MATTHEFQNGMFLTQDLSLQWVKAANYGMLKYRLIELIKLITKALHKRIILTKRRDTNGYILNYSVFLLLIIAVFCGIQSCGKRI
jgi:hypothetical protein